MSKGTVVIRVIGADVHAVGNKIIDFALREAGYNVIDLGVMVSQESTSRRPSRPMPMPSWRHHSTGTVRSTAMRQIEAHRITELVEQLCIEACCVIARDIEASFISYRETERSPWGNRYSPP